MSLREVTREIINLVENKTHIPVRIIQEPKLSVIAAVKMARKDSLPTHIVFYKPVLGESPDYLICYECGFILRFFSIPSEQRFDMVESSMGRDEVQKAILTQKEMVSKFRLEKNQVEELRTQFLGGLITHLRSVPIGLRVTDWLSSNYPELKDSEVAHVKKEMVINRESMSEQIKQITPLKVYQAAQSVSAAYSLYWAEKWNKPELFNPYRLHGFDKEGHSLLNLYKNIPDDPTEDKYLIDDWAKYLGINGWYNWVPYQPPE